MGAPIKARKGYASFDEACEFCRKNDVLFFGEGVNLDTAKGEFFRQTNKRISNKKISDARQEVCDWWGIRKAPILSTRTRLRERQWTAIRKWAEQNEEILSFAPNLKFCARVMQSDGVPCNPTVLQNSSSFMQLWHEARKGE